MDHISSCCPERQEEDSESPGTEDCCELPLWVLVTDPRFTGRAAILLTTAYSSVFYKEYFMLPIHIHYFQYAIIIHIKMQVKFPCLVHNTLFQLWLRRVVVACSALDCLC